LAGSFLFRALCDHLGLLLRTLELQPGSLLGILEFGKLPLHAPVRPDDLGESDRTER
jgi:hypothetical protein